MANKRNNAGKGLKKTITVFPVMCAVFAAVFTSYGASRTVSGDGSGNWNFCETAGQDPAAQFASDTKETAVGTDTATEDTAAAQDCAQTVTADSSGGPGSQTVYEFDGRKYVVESDWGTHYLTGFSPNADGSRRTASGVDATQGYTVSSTRANLGKIILIQGESGMKNAGDIHRYDGLYKCEDTGGTAVEYGTANTGNTPVVDLFFDTAEQAAQVSGGGWISARIYILREEK